MNHADKARDLFLEGYSCSQAVLCAFDDVTGLDRSSSARIASSFGGGIGRLREVCGTVSGALMALGMVCGYSVPGDMEAKKAHYHRVQEYAARFREKSGSIVCRDLLRGVSVSPGNDPEQRTPEYYAKRPCPHLVWQAAAILDEMLSELEIQPEEKEET